MSDDRTVHAAGQFSEDDYALCEVARYDRSGKWWLEFPLANRRRQPLRLSTAVGWAVWWEVDGTGTVHYGLPGGRTFDAQVRREVDA